MYPLSDGEVRGFFEDGFVIRRSVFSPDEIGEMKSAFRRLEETAIRLRTTQMHRGSRFVLEEVDEPGGSTRVRIHRVVWCGAAEPVLLEYGEDPRLVSPAAQLLGANEMNQLINQAHFKLPGDNVEFPWHQDSTHRRYGGGRWRDVNGRGSYVQTVIAIDPATKDNGPLCLIPGSCRLGHLGLPADGALPLDLDDRGAVSATMDPGDVLMFGPYTVHRSTPNLSDAPRRIFLNGYAYPGANSRRYPGRGAGRLLRAF